MASTPIYNWPTPDNTDLVKNGALAIRTLGDAIDTTVDTMIPETIFAAKGDLLGASANDTPAVLTVGANGETLVADNSTSTGLRWQGDFSVGRNKIINGDFTINQRAFTSTTTSAAYGFDRWFFIGVDGTVTYSAQTFTPGAAPVAGYEGTNFARIVSSGQTLASAQARLRQQIEDVRTFAGQTVTMSFWAKASSGTPYVTAAYGQGFGTGGSSGVFGYATKQTITTSWARYSFTMAIPSISGKTIGPSSSLGVSVWTSAGSDLNSFTDSLGIQNTTIDIWGVQVEAGNVATPFQTATGTIQGELAACQRYYYRIAPTAGNKLGIAMIDSTTVAINKTYFPVTMRIAPSALEQTGTATDYAVRTSGGAVTNCSAVPAYFAASIDEATTTFTVASGLTAGQAALGRGQVSGAYLGWSAEL